MAMEARSFANPRVLEFYRALPFNMAGSAETMAEQVRSYDPRDEYPPLRHVLAPGRRVLDIGCGAGWLSNAIALRIGCAVTGIDFNAVAIEMARSTTRELGVSVDFRIEDLFLYRPERPFDVVVSLGVLHHTDNCHAALRYVFSRCVRPGGFALIGLYHEFGRRPFLRHFLDLRTKCVGEEQLFQEFRRLFGAQGLDETHVRSWFRDQVLHPHETRHTLGELLPILRESGMRLLATSLNDFKPVASFEAVAEREPEWEQVAAEKLASGTYFPGFFTIFIRRELSPAP